MAYVEAQDFFDRREALRWSFCAAAEVLRLVSRDLDREARRPGAKPWDGKISAAE